VFKVALPEKLQPGEHVQVELEFRGVVPQDFGGSATPAGYGIFNYSEGVLALSGWYPILAVYDDQGWNLDPPSVIGDSSYSDSGFYTIDITLPKDMVVAATGVQVGAQALDGKAQLQYESGPARDFFLVASPDFQVARQPVGETIVNSYYLPGDEQGGRKALSVASDSLEVYTEKFGPYPYTEMDVVQAPMRNALGVEFPGIVLIGAKLYESPETPDFEVTVAHEAAHQWWYGVVGNDVFDEPWLDEALATYSSGLFYEFSLGPEYSSGLQSYWQERYTRLVGDVGDDLVTGSLAYFESLNKPAVYGGIVYVKGALFFAALRAEIGDQAFFEGLQNYYRSQYFRIAQADDLLSAFEDAAGRELDDFYQQWLYSKK
jgi:aminopeptidase N